MQIVAIASFLKDLLIIIKSYFVYNYTCNCMLLYIFSALPFISCLQCLRLRFCDLFT